MDTQDNTQENDDLEAVLGAAIDEIESTSEEDGSHVADGSVDTTQESDNSASQQPDATSDDVATTDESVADVAPSSWKPDTAAKWAELPAEIKAEIQRRETDYHKGIEQYKQYAQHGQEFERVISPHMDMIRQSGLTPGQAIQHLMQAHKTLTYGTQEQKQQALAIIARDSGIDLSKITPAAPIDPQVRRIIEQNRQLQQFQQQALEAQQQAVGTEIQQFAADPSNEHFEAVKQDMATMLQSGMAQTLQEAYDKAVWARPDLRQSLVEAQRTEAEKRGAQAAHRQRAKSAAVGIRGSAPSSNGALPNDMSLEDTVAAAIDGLI